MAIEQSSKITKFLTRLFHDAFVEGGDSIRFVKEKDRGRYSVQKGKVTLTEGEVRAEFVEQVIVWLALRGEPCSQLSLDESMLRVPPEVNGFSVDWCSEELNKRVNIEVEISSALSGAKVCALKRMRTAELPSISERLNVEGGALRAVENVLAGEPGIIIVAGPRAVDRVHGISKILGVIPGEYCGSLLQFNSEKLAETVNSGGWFVLSASGNDPIEILQTAKTQWGVAALSSVKLVAASASINQVCESCAKETTPPPELVAALPTRLRGASASHYRVGRGCEECAHSGVRGYRSIWSVLDVGLLRDVPEARGLDPAVLISLLYGNGLSMLLEEGVRQSFEGRMSLQAVLAAVKHFPAGYEDALSRVGSKESTTIHSLGSSDHGADVVTPSEVRERPLLLVVEDDPDQREILQMVLTNTSCDVMVASDGVEAWSLIEERQPDLVITDLMMPRMDGRELVKKLKAHPRFNGIPVLVLTVVTDVGREYELLDSGAEDYVEKSTQRRILLKRVENLLRRRRRSFSIQPGQSY